METSVREFTAKATAPSRPGAPAVVRWAWYQLPRTIVRRGKSRQHPHCMRMRGGAEIHDRRDFVNMLRQCQRERSGRIHNVPVVLVAEGSHDHRKQLGLGRRRDSVRDMNREIDNAHGVAGFEQPCHGDDSSLAYLG